MKDKTTKELIINEIAEAKAKDISSIATDSITTGALYEIMRLINPVMEEMEHEKKSSLEENILDILIGVSDKSVAAGVESYMYMRTLIKRMYDWQPV